MSGRAAAADRVPIERLPGISALARGLSTGTPDVRAFLPDPPDLPSVLSRARELGASPVVMTGQQAGLFTGPLLTMVKSVAARQLAREARLSAVFWCASEDHDLAEVTRLPLPTPDGVVDFGPDPQSVAANRAPVGDLPIAFDVGPYLEAAAAASGTTFDPALLATLRAFHEGHTYYEAFRAMLRFVLHDGALPVVDAAAPASKPALLPLAVRLVRERDRVREILRERAAMLERAGHPLQVKSDPHALPLFARVGGERLLLLEPQPGRFALKGEPGVRTFTEAEVIAFFERGDWLPSFSALSRPLAASVLHPAAATVLGPAEVAYWAQMHSLFSWAGIRPPVVLLRPMAALVDTHTRRLLETAGLEVRDVLEGVDALLARRGRDRAATPLARLEEAAKDVDARLAGLGPELLALDAGLEKPLDATRRNVAYALGKLTEKVTAAAGRGDEAAAKKIARLSAAIVPGGTLAERVTTPVPPLLRWGRDGLLAALEEGLRWDRPGLAVIAP